MWRSDQKTVRASPSPFPFPLTYRSAHPRVDRPELEPEPPNAAGDDWDMMDDDLANEYPRDILDLRALDLKGTLF